MSAELDSGAEFISDGQVTAVLSGTSLPAGEQEAIADVYASARLDALSIGMVAVSLFVLVALLLSTRLPARALTEPEAGAQQAPGEAAPARGP